MIRLRPQQHDLNPRSGLLQRKQTSPDHPGIVDRNAVPRLQIIHNPAERHDLAIPRSGIQHQHPRISAVLRRILGNQLLRKFVIKIRRAHPDTSSHIRKRSDSRRNR